jgi:hypothetical protein
MWIWVAAGIILGILLISSNRTYTRKINGEPNDHHFKEENDEEEELFEEFMIIDFLDEEEDIE